MESDDDNLLRGKTVGNGEPVSVGESTSKSVTNAMNKEVIRHFVTLAKESSDDQINLEHLQELFDNGAEVNCADKYGQTLLHEVARSWHTDVAVFLIEKGIRVDKEDKYGRTALHVAAATDYAEMVEFLVSEGASIEAKTKGESQTPLHFAARNDAVGSCKALMKLGANIEARDYRSRTPVHIAAELDRSETARWLFEHGADVGVMDNEGLYCMTHMITKMGPVARDALDIFHKTDRANRRQYFHLNLLEQDRSGPARKNKKGISGTFARTPLQVVVQYKQLDIIMHPVILKLLELKWNKYGKFGALKNLVINLFFILIWTTLAVGEPWQTRYLYIFPKDVWRIVFWCLALGMTGYYLIIEIWEIKSSRTKFRQWKLWRENQIHKDLKFCHPKWPEERSYLEREKDTLDELLPTYFQDFWNYFDWSIYFLNIVVFITHIVDVYSPSDPNNREPACCTPDGCAVTQQLVNNGTLTMKGTCINGAVNNLSLSAWNNRIFVLNIILIWLRLMKNMRAFRTLGPFVVMLGKIFYDILRFLYLYFEFYIPYACAFWMIFGNEPSISSMETVDNMLFSLYRITLVDDYQFDEMQAFDIVMAYILVGTFLGISAILCINLFIALLSDTFQRVYDNANSNAHMQQAMLCLNVEDNLSRNAKENFQRYLQTKCAPLDEYYDDDLTTMQDDNLKKVTIQIKEQLDELFDHLHIGETQDSDAEENDTKGRRRSFKFFSGDYTEYMNRSLLSRMSSRPDNDRHANEGIHRLTADLSVVSNAVSTLQVNNERTLKRMQTDIKEIKKMLQQFMSKEEKRRKKRDYELFQQSDYAGNVPLPVFPVEITTLPPPHGQAGAYSSLEGQERMHSAPGAQRRRSNQEDIMRRLGISSGERPRSSHSPKPDDQDLEMLIIPGASDSPQPQNLFGVASPTSGADVRVMTISNVDPTAQPGPSTQDDASGVGSSNV